MTSRVSKEHGTDLARITLQLRPTHHDTIPAQTGRAAHAMFLDALRRINPALSAAVHDGSGPKPITTSGLMPTPRGELLHLDPSRSLMLRYTTLHTDVTQVAVFGLMLDWMDNGVTLHDQPFITTSGDIQHTSYEALTQQALTPTHERTLTIRFSSPTTFKKTGDLQVPLPLPEYVFGSLMDRWQAFSDSMIPAEALRAFVSKQVVIQRHNIRTQPMRFSRAGRGNMVGFVGEVRFQALRSEAPYLGWLHALAQFATYSGIGAKTTMGMGQIAVPAPEKVH